MSVRLGQLKQDSSHGVSNFPPLIPHSYRWEGGAKAFPAAEKWPGNKNRSVKNRRVGKGPGKKGEAKKTNSILLRGEGESYPEKYDTSYKKGGGLPCSFSPPLLALSCLSVGNSPVGTCCFLGGEICSGRIST